MQRKAFDLTKYLHYIGLDNFTPKSDLGTLKQVIDHHALKFNYSNLQLYKEGVKQREERNIPSLHPDELFELMVEKKSAVYCFQNAELLAAALEACGFKVNRHLGRVMLRDIGKFNDDDVSKTPLTHEVLSVELDGKNIL